MNLKKALQDIFTGEQRRRKLLVYFAISLVPVLNWAAMGYVVQIIQNVAANKERPLPEWDAWERYFENGARVIGAALTYLLPVLTVWLAAGVFAGKVNSRFAIIGFISILLAFALLPYTMLQPALWPMLFIQTARRETMSACWQWGEMWHMVKRQATSYILLAVAYTIFAAATLYLIVVTFLGTAYVTQSFTVPGFLLFAWFVVTSVSWALFLIVTGHLAGQFVIQAEKKLKQRRKRKGV